METGKIIREVCKLLVERYVFEDVGKKLEAKLLEEYNKRSFDEIEDAAVLAVEINRIFKEVSNDGHLQIINDPSHLKLLNAERDLSKEEINLLKQERINREKQANFGFKKVEILESNIGYLDLRRFCHTDYASEVAIAAMNFLANTKAVIIDLKHNCGGEPEMVVLIASYFLGGRVLFNTIERRFENVTDQYWTQVHSPGKQMKEKDVYILISGSMTYSAAEDFTYGMQQLKRATVIGETTRGGGHPIDCFPILDLLVLRLPTARAVNPITKTNWEKVGVEPDIKVPSNQAFDVAYEMGLKKILEEEENLDKKMFLQLSLAKFSSRDKEIKIDKEILQTYEGQFGRWPIILKGNNLYFRDPSGKLEKLIPVADNIFIFEDEYLSSIGLVYKEDPESGKLLLHFLYTLEWEIHSSVKSVDN